MRIVGGTGMNCWQRDRWNGEDVLIIPIGSALDHAAIAEMDRVVRAASYQWQPTQPHALSYRQTAQLLGVSTKWLQRRVNGCRIPHHRIGRHVWWSPEQVETIRCQMRRGEQ